MNYILIQILCNACSGFIWSYLGYNALRDKKKLLSNAFFITAGFNFAAALLGFLSAIGAIS